MKATIEPGSGSKSGGNIKSVSVLSDVGRRRSSCGYCKSPHRTSISHGLWAFTLTVDDYQDLLDRGWRRSGCFLYKPEMENTCCPSYTIRLKASDYVPSKEQARVSRRMQRFLDGALDVKKQEEFMASEVPGSCDDHTNISTSAVKEDQIMNYLSDELGNACARSGEFFHNIQSLKASVRKIPQAKNKLLVLGSEKLLYSSNVSFQIAATVKRAESVEKDVIQTYMSPDIIAEKLASTLTELKESLGLSVRACKGHINFYSDRNQISLSKELQIDNVAKVSPTGCGNKRKKSLKSPMGKRIKLQVLLRRSSFDPEEYALYKRYQISVHNDPPDKITESSYNRFLVETPLVYVPRTGDDNTVPPCGFGSFHQQYLIDGHLVAVGIVDILPKCFSCKYLFWDPDFAFLSLGKYSSIQEIGWVKENMVLCPSLQYYYLGYYIHSCPKMRYKAAYRPSELLCPLRYQWVPFNIAKHLLDERPYVVLSDISASQNGESLFPHVLKDTLEQKHDEHGSGDSNDVCIDEEEMYDHDSANSNDETDAESGSEPEFDDVSDVLIEAWQSRRIFKEFREALVPTAKSYIETRLRRYVRAVGPDLSKKMVYSLE